MGMIARTRSEPPKRVLRWVIAAGMTNLPASLVGCGHGRPQLVPVSGQVLVDGKPVTTGSIRFTPAEGRPATGEIGPDGRFILTTFDADDGCVPGTHIVTVFSVESIGGSARRWNLPPKYSAEATSDYRVTIDGPIESLQIALTWGSGSPFVEKYGAE